MDRRLTIVLIAGVLIAGVCAYRVQTNQPLDYDAQVAAATTSLPAPLFEGVDEQNQMYRLASYFGRHRIVVVFFDGAAGADRSLELLSLRDHSADLRRLDVKAVAISRAIPQHNRDALIRTGELPCPLISDIDDSIHRRWGRMAIDGRPLPGLFLIDRKGTVAFHAGAPRPYADITSLWKDLNP